MGLFWLNGGFHLFNYFICVRLCFLFDSPWKRRHSAAPLTNGLHGIAMVRVCKTNFYFTQNNKNQQNLKSSELQTLPLLMNRPDHQPVDHKRGIGTSWLSVNHSDLLSLPLSRCLSLSLTHHTAATLLTTEEIINGHVHTPSADDLFKPGDSLASPRRCRTTKVRRETL